MKRIPAALHRHARIELLETRQLFAFGNADTAFGVDGRVTAAIKNQSANHLIEDISTLANGKILAGGDAGLLRLNADGTADNTYGSSGRVRIRGFNFKAQTINDTGTAYLVGVGAAGVLVAKYTSTGSLDANFGSVGTALVAGPKVGFKPVSIALQPDGKIVVAGDLPQKDGSQKIRLYRLDTAGALDNTFSGDGFVDLALGKASLFTPLLTDRVNKITVLDSGKIMIAGGSISYAPDFDSGDGYFSAVNGDAMAIAARLNSDGTLDSSYGSGGFKRAIYADSDAVDAAAPYNRNDVLPTAAAFRDDGTAAIGAFDDQAVVVTFGTGAGSGATATSRPDLGSPLRHAPIDLTYLNDGRLVYLTYAATRTDLGYVMATTTAAEFGPEVYTANATGIDEADFQYSQTGALGIAGDGRLLVGGRSNKANEFDVQKYSPGKENDPRPDEFANGTVNSIKQGTDGSLHVAYYDSVAKNLKYVYRAPNGLWNAPVTVDSTSGAGTYISINVTKENQPVIAYFESSAADLKLARSTDFGKNWAPETVASKGSVGMYPSLLIDSKNRPTVAFYSKTAGDLIFGQLKKTAAGTEKWGFETIDSVGDVGRECTMVVSPNTGRFTVAYYDVTNQDIKWAAQNTGGAWETQKAADAPDAQYLSMAYSNDIAPAISYYDPKNADLDLVYYNENKWKTKVVAGEGLQGQWSHAMFSSLYSDLSIFAFNKTGNRVSRYSNVFNTPKVTTAASSGGQYLSADFANQFNVLAYVSTSVNKLVVRYGPSPVG